MTRTELLQAIKEGRPDYDDVFFRPILMRFAARFIDKSYREFLTDYKTLVQANIECMEYFETDAVGLISDPFRETAAFGTRLYFPEDGVPECQEYLVTTMDDVRHLKNPDVYRCERTLDRIKGVEEFRQRLGDDIPVIGWIEGPLAEACDLVGVTEMLMQTLLAPDFARALYEKCLVTAKDFARAQIEAGCDVIGIGDSICSQVSPAYYYDAIMLLHKELVDFIHANGAMVQLHICGDITRLLPYIHQVGPDIVDLDWMVDMDSAYDVLGPGIIRCGNLNPVAVLEQSTADEIFTLTQKLVAHEQGKRFILSGGCEITPNTPIENLRAMREATLKKW